MQIHLAIRSLREACALQHTALNTEKSYLHWVRKYAAFLSARKPDALGKTEEKIEAFLTGLALQGVSVSTQNQAFSALLFFYRYALKQQLGNINSLRAKRPAGLRHCPARDEVLQLLAHVADTHGYPTRLVVHLIYACGLRVCEPLNLRIKDVDLKQRRLYVHQSKGNKARVVLFPSVFAHPWSGSWRSPRLWLHRTCPGAFQWRCRDFWRKNIPTLPTPSAGPGPRAKPSQTQSNRNCFSTPQPRPVSSKFKARSANFKFDRHLKQ